VKGEGPGGKVLFFYGCLIDKVFPEIGRAVLKTLEHFRVEVIVPEGQGCCGIPALSAGDLQTFQALVEYNLERLTREPCEALITACPTCAATIKKIWPVLARGEDGRRRGRLRVLAEKTVDVLDFLVNRLGFPGEALPETRGPEQVVTYHDPCHLRKSLGVIQPPRTILQALPGLTFREMNEPDACCGCGGSFTLEHYELSKAVGKRKLEHIRQSAAEVVATACPACLLQITDLLSRGGERIRVRHVVELLADNLDAEGTGRGKEPLSCI
jgi:glycolate oxidase iron-sulfur subunit